MNREILALATILALLPTFVWGGLGDPAPPLRVQAWVHGKPVDIAAKPTGDKPPVHVVLFWSTTNKFARKALAELEQLQKKHGAKIVTCAISDQEAETIRNYVTKIAPNGLVPLAVDDNKKAYEDYVLSLGGSDVPYVVIVDQKRRFAWGGAPGNLEAPLGKILDGTYQIEARVVEADQRKLAMKLLTEYFGAATKGAEAAELRKLGDQILDIGKNFPMALVALARNLHVVPGIKNPDMELAVRASRLALDQDSKNSEAKLYLGKSLAATGKVEEALSVLRAGIAEVADEGKKRAWEMQIKRCEDLLEEKKKS